MDEDKFDEAGRKLGEALEAIAVASGRVVTIGVHFEGEPNYRLYRAYPEGHPRREELKREREAAQQPKAEIPDAFRKLFE